MGDNVGMKRRSLRLSFDPRIAQLVIVGSLLMVAILRGFMTTPCLIMLMVTMVMVTLQMVGNSLINRPFSHNLSSALISTASLLLLLRSNQWWVWLLAAIMTIGSKYLLHIRYKHCFNPTNFAIVIVLLFNLGWVNHGRWGHYWWGIAVLCLLGVMILSQVRYYQTTVGFLLAYGSVVVGRGLYLQEPWSLIGHQFSHISLIIFAFFMISDPRTTPNNLWHRWGFGMVVGVVGAVWQYWWFEPNAIFYSLFFCYPIVWVADWVDQDNHRPFNWS